MEAFASYSGMGSSSSGLRRKNDIRNVRHRRAEYTRGSRSHIWLESDCTLNNPHSLVVVHAFSPVLGRQRQMNL